MKKYTVTQLSGEFRLQTGMSSDEMEKFVRDNWNYGVDYSDEFQTFELKRYALDFFEYLKKQCIVKEFPSNKLMMVHWLRLDETEVDEDGDEDFMETLDEYFPSSDDHYMKNYICTTIAKNAPNSGSVVMSEERIAKQFPRALELEVGQSIELTEEEVGYTDFQNFYTDIKRLS